MSNLHLRNLPVPFLSQRKNTYVFEGKYEVGKKWQPYDPVDYPNNNDETFIYGNDEENENTLLKVSMANRSCNITCLAMLLHYFGIKKDSPDEMMKAYFETTIDSVTDKSVMALQLWKNLKAFVENKYSVTTKYYECVKDNNGNIVKYGCKIADLQKYIAAGYPVMVSIGAKKSSYSGHIVVVRGFTQIDGKNYVIVNDPFGTLVDVHGDLLKYDNSNTSYYAYYSSGYKDDDPEDIDDNDTSKMYDTNGSNGDNVVIKLSEFKKLMDTNNGTRALVVFGNLWQQCNGQENTKSESLFPISAAYTWHNGIHLNMFAGQYVRSIGAGRLLALRNKDAENGSASFMLVQHQVAKKTGSGETLSNNERIIPFYALYMHLETIDIKLCAEHFFKRGTLPPQYNFKWLYQLFLHMLPHQCIIANEDPDSSTEGMYTNGGYAGHPVYMADYISGAGLRKKDPETKVDFFHGRRMLVHLLPRGELFDKLLDPANYTNDYFQQQMLDKDNFKSNDKYIFFHKYDAADDVGETSTGLVASSESIEAEIFCSMDADFFGSTRENKSMFKRNAKKLHALNVSGKEGGEVVSLTDLKNESAESESKNVFFSNKNRINSFYFASMQENKNYSKSLQGFEYANISQIGDFFTGDNIKKIKDAWKIQFGLRTSEDEGEAYRVIDNFYTAMSALCFEVDTQYHAGDSNKKDILKSLEKYCKSYGDAKKESFEAHINAIIANRGEKKYDGVKTWRQYLHRVLHNCLSKKHGTFDCGTVGDRIIENENGEQIVKTFLYSLNKVYPSLDEQRAIIEVACCTLVSIAGADVEGGESECFKIEDGSIKALLSAYHDISFFAQFEAYIDYFVEIGKDDVIGRCGRYNDEHDMIHFEIFSGIENNIYDELNIPEKSIIKDTDKDAFYDAESHTNILEPYVGKEHFLGNTKFMDFESFKLYNPLKDKFCFEHISEWSQDLTINKFKEKHPFSFLMTSYAFDEKIRGLTEKNYSNEEYFENCIVPYQFTLSKIVDKVDYKDNFFIYYYPRKFIESLITKDT